MREFRCPCGVVGRTESVKTVKMYLDGRLRCPKCKKAEWLEFHNGKPGKPPVAKKKVRKKK